MKWREELGSSASLFSAELLSREQILSEHLARERQLLTQAFAERAEQTRAWEQTITATQKSAWGAQLASYQSLTRSMVGLLGGSVKEQAKVMIPFEIAEATREFARFLGTRDPGALASSLKHALAARQYAAVAKSGGATSSESGGRASGRAEKPTAEPTPAEPERKARIVVNVGRKIGVVDTYEFARTLISAINENLSDDVILEVGS